MENINRGTILRKMNIIDIIIILVVVLGAAGFFVKMKVANTITPFTTTQKIETEFIKRDFPEEFAKRIKVGMIVKDVEKGEVFGRLKDIKIGKSEVYTNDSKGDIKKSNQPDYVSVRLRVEGTGLYTDEGVTFGSSSYYIGRDISISINNIVIEPTVENFKKLN